MNKIFIGVVGGLIAFSAVPVNAGVYSETKSAQAVFAATSGAELPGQAASFVSHKEAKRQSDAAVGAMKAAIGINPGASAAVLEAIVKAAPATSPEVAAAAVAALPKYRLDLARIAARSAPAYAAKIAARLAKLSPRDAKLFADAIAEVVPSAKETILLAATSAASAPGVSDANKALDFFIIQDGPYQPGFTFPIIGGLKIENANTFRTYAAP